MKKKFTLSGARFAMQTPQFALAIVASAGLLGASAALAQEVAPAKAKTVAEQKKAADKKQAAAETPQDETQTVIVTGTVGATAAKAANVSYSVLDAKDLGKFTPMSADDYLRDMPGVVVESNEGVARNEVYTRGLTVGTNSPTTANFWASILEDGLPVIPVKFNNLQDSSFYRADISTNRVEAVRGGTAGTSLATSAGAVFNFMSGAIQPGTAIQTKLGVEGQGDARHLSWKQVDMVHGWRNDAGDLRASVSGFYRTSTGAADPGYPLNLGGQLKVRVQKSYETSGGGGGTFGLTVKHLDDSNSWNGQFTQPVHGYADPVPADGFIRSGNMFLQGGQHTVRTDVVDGPGSTIYHDPTKGTNYVQDALWLKWDHDTGGRWSFNSAIKKQKSRAFLQQAFYNAGVVSLANVSLFQDAFFTNQTGFGGGDSRAVYNLNRTAGHYEIYDIATGALRASINNNVGKVNGIDYRTGKNCGAGSASSPTQCVTFSNLPNQNFDLGGGVVNGFVTPVSNTTANQDVVYITNTNLGTRVSNDLMVNFSATYTGDTFKVQAGLFAVQANQGQETYYNGRGISAFENGDIRNLGVRYITGNNTYQLSDEGGWGRVGGGYADGGYTAYSYKDRERDIQPMLGASWSPGKWDLNASYKGTLTLAKTHTVPFVTTPEVQGANSLNYGGLDGNKLTWYDNQNYVRAPLVEATQRAYLKNWSGSFGYNFTPGDKLYYRHSLTGNNITGILSRYQNTFNAANKPLFPQVDLKQDEIAYVFGRKRFNGQLTLFRTEMLEWIQQTPLNVDGTTYVVEYLNHYLTKGVEGWFKWRVTPKFTWQSTAMYSNAHSLAVGSFNAGVNGPEDDKLTTVSGLMARTPKWVLSNTLSYELGDFQIHLRHRYMHKRKYDANPVNKVFLAPQRNLDLSVQYAGFGKVKLAVDVRNVLNNKYINNFDTMVPTPNSSVSKADIMTQLPTSAGWVSMNAPRSIWFTGRYDF